MSVMKKKRVLFISSTGGHLSEMMKLSSCFDKYEYYIVTEKTKSNLSLRDKYGKRVSFLVYGTKDHLFSYFKIHPDYIITTGTHTAGPICYFGKIFGSRVIYIETFANITTKTITGKLIYPIADLFVVQWKSMLELYPKAKFGGWIF